MPSDGVQGQALVTRRRQARVTDADNSCRPTEPSVSRRETRRADARRRPERKSQASVIVVQEKSQGSGPQLGPSPWLLRYSGPVARSEDIERDPIRYWIGRTVAVGVTIAPTAGGVAPPEGPMSSHTVPTVLTANARLPVMPGLAATAVA